MKEGKFKGFTVYRKPPYEPFEMFQTQYKIHLAIFETNEQGTGHSIPLLFVDIKWERSIVKEDDILQIVVTGSIESCVLFVKELELIDSMSIDNKIPDFEEVCKKLEETGLMLLG